MGERGEHISNFEHFECRWTTLQKLGRCASLNQVCWISGNKICSGITTFPYVLVPKNKNTTRDGGRLDICNKILQLQFLRQKITPKNAYFATFANLQKKRCVKEPFKYYIAAFLLRGYPRVFRNDIKFGILREPLSFLFLIDHI